MQNKDDLNKKYKLDEDFTNSAWLNMKEILDQEMPEKKKKRKGFIFFWLFGAVLILGIGSYLLLGNYSVKKSIEKGKTADYSPAKEVETKKLDGSEIEIDANEEIDLVDAEVGSEIEINNAGNENRIELRNSVGGNEIKSNNYFPNNGVNKVTEIEKNYTNKSKTNLNTIIFSENNKQENTIVNKKTSTENKIESKEKVLNPVTTNKGNVLTKIPVLNGFLPSLENELPEIEEVEKEKEEKESKPIAGFRYLHTGGFAGLTTNTKLKANGNIVGIFSQFSLGQKFIWQPELSYSRVNTSVLAEDLELIQVPVEDVAASPSTYDSTIVIGSQSLINVQYINLYSIFAYRPHNMIQFNLGPGVSKSVRYKTNMYTEKSAYNLFTGNERALDFKSQVQQWDAGLEAGFTFYPQKNIGIDFRSHTSFNKIKVNKVYGLQSDSLDQLEGLSISNGDIKLSSFRVSVLARF